MVDVVLGGFESTLFILVLVMVLLVLLFLVLVMVSFIFSFLYRREFDVNFSSGDFNVATVLT